MNGYKNNDGAICLYLNIKLGGPTALKKSAVRYA